MRISWHDWQVSLAESPYRLRFELAGDGSSLSRFTQAFDRARHLARAALRQDAVLAVVAAFPDPERVAGARELEWDRADPFEILADMGVDTEDCLERWQGRPWPQEVDDGDRIPWTYRAALVSWREAEVLLWNQVATDLGVAPRAPVQAWLADPEQSICVYAYDDRGMDVSALSQEPLQGLYERFRPWLLECDHAKADQGLASESVGRSLT